MPIEIGLTEFTLDVPALPEIELRAYSLRLFDIWDQHLEDRLPLPDYALHLELEEGSLKGRGRVAAAAIALVTAVSTGGGFISGVKEIVWVVKEAGTLLAREAAVPYGNANPQVKVRRGAGKLGEIERLIQRVQNGQLDRHEAAILARAVFAEEQDEPGMEELRVAALDAVDTAPRAPTQLYLPLEEFEVLPTRGSQRRQSQSPRPPKPKPTLPPPERFRAEVWRESKRDPKRVQITPL